MNAIIKESPAVYFEGKAKDPDQVVGEADLTSSMFEFRVFLPPCIVVPAEEMSEPELLAAADAAGTFHFLDAEGEDIYQQ
jgi:hypothetical protein